MPDWSENDPRYRRVEPPAGSPPPPKPDDYTSRRIDAMQAARPSPAEDIYREALETIAGRDPSWQCCEAARNVASQALKRASASAQERQPATSTPEEGTNV